MSTTTSPSQVTLATGAGGGTGLALAQRLARTDEFLVLLERSEPEEVAGTVEFLASADAGFVNGAVGDVNGGCTADIVCHKRCAYRTR